MHHDGKGQRCVRHCHCPDVRVERFLEPCLLLLIHGDQSHGYELMTNLQRYGFDRASLEPTTIYRYLRRLEREGYLTSSWETGEAGPAKRLYAVTPEGEELIHAWAVAVTRNLEALNEFLGDYRKRFADR